LWELTASVDGYNKSQGGDTPVEPPSNEEFDSMVMSYHESNMTIQ